MFFSARPNLFVGHVANSALYSKWYFEVTIDHVEQMSSIPPHFRVGWGNTMGYVPYPGGGKPDFYDFSCILSAESDSLADFHITGLLEPRL